DGTIWIGARAVLYSVRSGTGSSGIHEMPLPEEIQRKTRAISFAPDGTMWVGGPTGLARFDGSQWAVFTKANGPVTTQWNCCSPSAATRCGCATANLRA